jgi:predicted RNase H-like nuclease (RuvC/YqgF family)
MKPSEESSQPHRSQSDPQPSLHAEAADEQEFERSLEVVERSLQDLKERYAQVQRDQQRQKELQHRFEEVRQDRRRNRSQQLKAELQQIKAQLEVLEVSLESSLFSWSSLKEPFWQAVRFAGIGIVIGWLLKSCAG